MAKDLRTELTGLIDTAAREHGYELVLLEMGGAKHNPLVRIYLDQEGGIGIDAITAANRWIKELLDPLPAFERGYTLEVSSPGIERPLVTAAHFRRFQGSDARVTLAGEVAGHKRFTGRIAAVADDAVTFVVDDTELVVPLRAISRARLRADFDLSQEGKTDGL